MRGMGGFSGVGGLLWPILLCELNIDYDPTPFRFYHSWFDIHGFDVFVSDAWRNIDISETDAMFRMAKKLRILKGHIRKVSSDVLEERLDIKNKLSSLMNMESCELAQKDKVQWAIEDGRWTDDPNAVKKEFFSHFQIGFDTPRASRPLLDMEFPNKLSRDQASDIERSFSKEEIKQAVWDCGLDKSPGPDGFTFGFYRRFWSLIECDVVEAVNHFYNNGFCHKGGNSSFIALISKTQGANMVKDYRPISLIGSLYKIITKLLIKCDVVEAVNHFYNNGFCHKGGNSSFIALISKTQGANMVKDYRPISLIGSLYKIITKLRIRKTL
nr:RNA-directed DNA polymerase, eukaryota, reverse transcriptase zinc-binding domain protein [Tanacetum cinerariifolium]